jgi:hypothetical protein
VLELWNLKQQYSTNLLIGVQVESVVLKNYKIGGILSVNNHSEEVSKDAIPPVY